MASALDAWTRRVGALTLMTSFAATSFDDTANDRETRWVRHDVLVPLARAAAF